MSQKRASTSQPSFVSKTRLSLHSRDPGEGRWTAGASVDGTERQQAYRRAR